MSMYDLPYFFLANAPKLVTGTASLIAAAIGWAALIIGGSTTISGIVQLVKMQHADEQEQTVTNKKLKRNIACGAAASCFGGLVTLILSFYK